MPERKGRHKTFHFLCEWYELKFNISQMLEGLSDELHRDDAGAGSGYQEAMMEVPVK